MSLRGAKRRSNLCQTQIFPEISKQVLDSFRKIA
jgi:hypothetical protein